MLFKTLELNSNNVEKSPYIRIAFDEQPEDDPMLITMPRGKKIIYDDGYTTRSLLPHR